MSSISCCPICALKWRFNTMLNLQGIKIPDFFEVLVTWLIAGEGLWRRWSGRTGPEHLQHVDVHLHRHLRHRRHHLLLWLLWRLESEQLIYCFCRDDSLKQLFETYRRASACWAPTSPSSSSSSSFSSLEASSPTPATSRTASGHPFSSQTSFSLSIYR